MAIEKIRIGSHQELEDMLAKEIGMVEKDLNVICSNVPVNDKASLDVLCHDTNGQLVILQLSVDQDDSMLLHGIQSLDYVDKFKSFLKATYNKFKIDDKEKPRLILIAPSYSDAVRHAVESMKGIRVDLYEWEYLKLGDHKGLRLQPLFSLAPEKPKDQEEKPVEKKHEPKPIKKKELEPKPVEKKEEPKPEPPKPEPETPKEVPPSPPHEEKPKETKEPFRPEKEEPHRRKLRLF